MSREIRITIDDDEVFERMRRRKDERDLSWEEALKRGLGPDAPRRGRPPRGSRSSERLSPFDPDFDKRLEEQIREALPGNPPGPRRGTQETPGDADLGTWIKTQVGEALHGSFEPESGSLDAEIDRLEGAEDAVLSFDFLEEPREVPLRVNLRSGPDGLDAEVIAVRTGKGTSGMNRFDEAERKAIARHLATEGTASLRLTDEATTYDVVPILEWGRDGQGAPTVTDVEVVSIDV